MAMTRMVALALMGAGMVLMTAQPLAAQQQAQADFFEQLNSFYQTAGEPQFVNDHAGRLAIYRATLARLDAAPAAVRADARFARARLFYEVAIATTMPDAGEVDAGLAEVARLIPLTRDYLRSASDDAMMTDALARLLRVEGQFAQRRNDLSAALARFREAIALTRSLLPPDGGDISLYGARSLAIDLDNLSNMEAQAGNRIEANAASAEAVRLFRILAERDPSSRPAQGSLLIALARRAINFGDAAALAEAEGQMAAMESRGMMTSNYAPVRQLLAELRNRAPR